MIQIKEFFDKDTFTLTYVVWDIHTKDSIIIDPVLNYDPAASKLTRASIKTVVRFIQENSLVPHYIFETHAHADHVSGSQQLKKYFPNSIIAIGEKITIVQETFSQILDLVDFPFDGRQFDRLLKNHEVVNAGSLKIETLFTPGHTPACVTYRIEDCAFTGDVLFMPDSGVGRCDFPDGSAEALYDSVNQVLYKLAPSIRVFVGHDYQPNGRLLKFESTIEEEKHSNIYLNNKTTKEEFVKFRTERDKTLSPPKLLVQSIQININAGKLPTAHGNGKHYLSIPIELID